MHSKRFKKCQLLFILVQPCLFIDNKIYTKVIAAQFILPVGMPLVFKEGQKEELQRKKTLLKVESPESCHLQSGHFRKMCGRGIVAYSDCPRAAQIPWDHSCQLCIYIKDTLVQGFRLSLEVRHSQSLQGLTDDASLVLHRSIPYCILPVSGTS